MGFTEWGARGLWTESQGKCIRVAGLSCQHTWFVFQFIEEKQKQTNKIIGISQEPMKDSTITFLLSNHQCKYSFHDIDFFRLWMFEILHSRYQWRHILFLFYFALVPSHYLNQCCNIVDCTIENKFRWDLIRNLYIFIQENAFENVVFEMTAMLSRPQCVNPMCLDPSMARRPTQRIYSWLVAPFTNMV